MIKLEFSKILCFLCILSVSEILNSQNLHHEGGDFWLVGSEVLFVGGNVTSSGDSGVEISLLGDSTTNNPDLIVSGTNSGTVGFYRNQQGDPIWSIYSSPVDESIVDFAELTENSLRTNAGRYALAPYVNTNAVSNRWDYYPVATISSAGNFSYGQGYALSRTSNGQLYASGNVENNTVVKSLTTATGSHFWHAVGNPFTAHLPGNMSANTTNLLGNNADVLDPSFVALYVWNGTSYDVINHASDAYYIPAGQGFMIRVKDNNEDFTIDKALMTHPSETTTFFREDTTLPELTITLENAEHNSTTKIKYLENTTSALDVGYDAGAYQDGTPSFALNTRLVENDEGIDFTLQCLPNNEFETLVVPLSVFAESGSNLSFKVEKEEFPEDINVFIEDRTFNTFYLLEEEDTFNVSLENSISGVGRFYLHTSENSTLSNESLDQHDISIFKSNKHEVTITGLENGESSTFQMYDMTGKMIYVNKLKASNYMTIELPSSISSGIYIIRLEQNKTRTFTEKIVIE